MDDLLADFIEETRELLEASESEVIAWEANPGDRARLDAIFRFVHTVKGNCGFFDFPRLEKLSHAAEDALSDVRKGLREADAALVTNILKVIDRIAEMVTVIEAGEELSGDDSDLIAALSENSGDDIAVTVETPASEGTASGEVTASGASQRSIRLPVELLDRVMSGVSDMVLARNDLGHRLREAGNQPTIDGPFERLTSILTDVRDAVTRMRMQRIEHLFTAFPRLVRDLSSELGKQVMIDLEGGDVELDREMIEMIRDPMIHIIRNAIDHGIEPPAERLKAGKREIAILAITARQSGNRISISVSDDGRGLNQEKIGQKAVSHGIVTEAQLAEMSRKEVLQLVFAPGLSTADQVSSISGRGVGLDVVQANLEKVGGSIRVTSEPGKNTEFTLQIPLTLSIIAGLTVEAGGQRFAIPQTYVEEIVHGDTADLDKTQVGDASLVTFRGERTPCLSLAQVLQLEPDHHAANDVIVFLKLPRGGLFAIAVDAIHNHGDLVVKPLAPVVMRSEVFAGSTLLDNGQPILMLDIPNIAAQHGVAKDTGLAQLHDTAESRTDESGGIPMAMVFEGFDQRRRAVRLELVRRIETVPAAAVDRSGPRLKAVVDGEILPLVGLEREQETGGQLRMLRLSDGSSELLYAVAAIEDAAKLDGELTSADGDPFVEAMTLINGATVALVDGHALFASFGAIPRRATSMTCHLPDSEWARTILAPLVKAAGYHPQHDASTPSDVAIVLDQAEPPSAAGEVIRLRSVPDDIATPEETDASIYRYDREAVLRALRAAGKGEAA
jgi:two-component system chemotaxis sensor kinase CheA